MDANTWHSKWLSWKIRQRWERDALCGCFSWTQRKQFNLTGFLFFCFWDLPVPKTCKTKLCLNKGSKNISCACTSHRGVTGNSVFLRLPAAGREDWCREWRKDTAAQGSAPPGLPALILALRRAARAGGRPASPVSRVTARFQRILQRRGSVWQILLPSSSSLPPSPLAGDGTGRRVGRTRGAGHPRRCGGGAGVAGGGGGEGQGFLRLPTPPAPRGARGTPQRTETSPPTACVGRYPVSLRRRRGGGRRRPPAASLRGKGPLYCLPRGNEFPEEKRAFFSVGAGALGQGGVARERILKPSISPAGGMPKGKRGTSSFRQRCVGRKTWWGHFTRVFLHPCPLLPGRATIWCHITWDNGSFFSPLLLPPMPGWENMVRHSSHGGRPLS